MAWEPTRLGICAVLCALFAGCTSMAGSTPFDWASSRSNLACTSSLGAYSLPRRQIKVSVKSQDNTKHFGLDVSEGGYIPDPHHIYCLDFLASLVADERIGIKRSDNNALLLERVYTKSIDQTKDNAKKLIQAGADLFAFNRAQDLARDATFGASVAVANTIREFNIDPFVLSDMHKVNGALRPFGYCIYVRRAGDALVPDWSEHLCHGDAHGGWRTHVAGPSKLEGPSYADIVDPRPVSDEIRKRGIFYRPEITHILVIMKQDQPGIAGSPWHRAGTVRVSLPNAAPPFVLKVERALFSKAETDITFKSGIIQSVAVDKESELQAVSTFAVEVVQIVQKIPVVALAIFDNTVENRLALIDANQKLIKTLQEYNTARGLPSGDPRLLTPGTNALIMQGYGSPQRSANEDAISACMRDPAYSGDSRAAQKCRDIAQGNL